MSDSGQPGRSGAVSRSETNSASTKSSFAAPQAPAISLPKGGGAIRGIGEKFAATPVTGTGSMSVPIATSPGRSGFGPELSLSYDSGAGNGPFGFGWSLSLPSITRKTDKGLPQYRDAEESDVFILSGAEDPVPAFKKDAAGDWIIEDGRLVIFDEPRTTDSGLYRVRRYRPRIEGLFARVERWTSEATGEIHWRSITRDNITTLYGRTTESRIADPNYSRCIFTWLISESYDDKGNAIVYEYAAENDNNVDRAQANERNRVRTANRYLKRIKYGNRVSRLVQPDLTAADWLFELVFDYDEGHYEPLAPNPALPENAQHQLVQAAAVPGLAWSVRPDPFSSHRSGFEIRTYRRCRRMLMFHHFDELGDEPYLVRSTEFDYADLDYSLPIAIEAELAHQGSTRFASFIRRIMQSGYVRDDTQTVVMHNGVQYATYLKKSLPPLELAYSRAAIQDAVVELDTESLENLPIGLDGTAYHWVDLDGEGLSGILTEQANAWFYKPNLGDGHFGPLQVVAAKPDLAMLSTGRQQLLDLAGDGQIDLVAFAGPAPGFYERTQDQGWESFRPFASLPSIAWDEPNLRFVDLNGDGHADVLITEHNVFTWHPSLAEAGFGPAQRVRQPLDEEQGPRLVLADGTQSIYLADMCGDGLTDLVRVRNGEICYWPNLGYGRFGAKITMDNAPWFDIPDQFDQRRIRLADIDGSGTSDIIYLGRNGVDVYFNQSGNRWSTPRRLSQFPSLDDLSSVTTVDLLGNGTACLVWSSPLPGDARRPMRYIDLMGGQKPNLLITSANNLGAETHVQYAPSTKFYLADKAAGKPWITRLPFPVHCVEKVIVTDKWRNTTFTSTYSYHHGYFDGIEREFRGFGRVEQVDAETFDTFAAGNTASPYITDDQTLYQPPVKTVTWYHTGAFVDRAHILSHYRAEYFPAWFEALHPDETNVLGDFRENPLPEPDLADANLSAEEWREALRACKGMLLRQEIYELDVDALARGEQLPVRLYSTAYHNCHIRRLQPKAANRHAVFHVTESEAITYHYELDLRQTSLSPDPRAAHTLNLQVDELGNVLQAASVVYPRLGRHRDTMLPDGAEALIASVQTERHIAYIETRYTNDAVGVDDYRLRLPCDVRSYELTGIELPGTGYFTLAQLRAYRLSDVYQTAGIPVAELPYHALPNRTTPQKRLIEHVRTLYFDENLRDPLLFGTLNRLGLTYEAYKLALTDDLLGAIFSADRVTPEVRGDLADASVSGYLSGTALLERFPDAAKQYWLRSGIAGFADAAAERFYLPERYTDPFGNVTTLEFDDDDLFLRSSTDLVNNTVRVEAFDYRVLAPQRIRDINDNLSEVRFDILAMPTAMALLGKGAEADSLADFDDALLNPDRDTLVHLFTADYDEAAARWLLRGGTARHIYYFGETLNADGSVTWAAHPACACGLLREKHAAQLAPDETSPLQAAFEYSDGLGSVLVKKIQAEPERGSTELRWIASGKVILNNKGKPVKQYEPYFSPDAQRFEEPEEVGVTPVMYYDAAGRLIRTEQPDGAFSRVEFSPWHVASYDPNDTVLEPNNAWYARMTAASATPAERRAARLAASHADTPATTFLDSLGREVVGVAHNRYIETSGLEHDERYVTFTRLDAEGKPLWIRDARGNRVMQYIHPPMPTGAPVDYAADFVPCYDIAGNLLFQHSMDAGDRWTISDAAGKPLYAWDVNDRITETGATVLENRTFLTAYDQLRRPLEQRLRINGGDPQVIERFVYGEDQADDRARNLRGQLYQHYDPSGLATNQRFDFKGNALETTRQIATSYSHPVVDWTAGSPTGGLEAQVFTRITEYDALSRMARLYNWHRGEGSNVAVYEPLYNERGLLAGEDLVVRARKTATSYEEVPPSAGVTGTRRTHAIREIRYDAKGQRERIRYGNGTTTRYHYDPLTFRLSQLRSTRPGYEPPFPGYHSNLSDDQVLQQLVCTYDPVGNIVEICDEAYEPVYFKNQKVEPRSQYAYDALYRLIEASGRENRLLDGPPDQFERPPEVVAFSVTNNALRNYTQRYTYDPAGNIEQVRHVAAGGSWTRSYNYAADSNRLLQTWTGSSMIDVVRYDYDTHGSMLNLNRVPDEYRLRWDYRDMIQTVNLGGGGRAWYSYDASKQRARKRIERIGGAVEERLYLGGMELYRSYAPGGAIVEEIETYHLFVADQRALIVDDVLTTNNLDLGTGVLYRYQYGNHLGSVAVELDADATIISYEEYHPYGTAAYHAKGRDVRATTKRYRYTGMERDEETRLSYHTARYYAPWIGRWTASDPKGTTAGLNLFIYASNNPIGRLDPTGSQDHALHDIRPQAPSPAAVQMIPRAGRRYTEHFSTEAYYEFLQARRIHDLARQWARLHAHTDFLAGAMSGREPYHIPFRERLWLQEENVRPSGIAGFDQDTGEWRSRVTDLAEFQRLLRLPGFATAFSEAVETERDRLRSGAITAEGMQIASLLPELAVPALGSSASSSSMRSLRPSGQRPNEITTLTNVEADIAAADVLPQYNPGSGFSGVYNPSTGRWVALASGDASLASGRPIRTVDRFGGHANAEEALLARTGLSETRRNVGFVLIWEGNGTVRIRWNSGQINNRNFGANAAPQESRAPIIQAIESETGFRVIE